MERLFDLAISPAQGKTAPAGHVGAIVANSFMKREFGKKLVEEYVPRWDLTHVVDTSGAYIPGHGTPTVILIGRSRGPVTPELRAVLGIRGEPSTPVDPAKGKVWSSILQQIDRSGSESEFVSVNEAPRERFASHPWSLQGGGANALKARIEGDCEALEPRVTAIGRVTHTGRDEAYFIPVHAARAAGIPEANIVLNVEGDRVRDWMIHDPNATLFPYHENLEPVTEDDQSRLIRFLWPHRTHLWLRREPNGNHREIGLTWYEWSRFQRERFRTPLSIAFAFVGTHNHFVLDRGGKVFKQSAPVIKLPEDASEDDHLALLGLLNSSAACFWMKQVFHNKGATSDTGVLQDDPERFRFEFDGTKLKQFPIPKLAGDQQRALLQLSRELDRGGTELSASFLEGIEEGLRRDDSELKVFLEDLLERRERLRQRMVALQEELDWLAYEVYGIIDGKPGARSRGFDADLSQITPLDADERLYRLIQQGRERQLSKVEEARLALIRNVPALALLERPDYKRRWFRSAGAYDARNLTDDMLVRRALEEWLLDRLEEPDLWQGEPALISTARLADSLRHDARFREVASLYRGRPDVELEPLVRELVIGQGVPFLAAQRYKPSGLRKRARWEETWELQRAEDRIDARAELPAGHPDHLSRNDADRLKRSEVGEIPVPPKYTSADFRASSIWRLRGKLDVPKERFVLYPGAEREADPTPVLTWAGYDHLQQARALATWYIDARQNEGWPPERLIPLLAGIVELLPWLHQWHDEPDPDIGMGMGEYFAAFVEEEARAMGVSVEELERWER